jgi:hypothetical protein
MVLLPRACTLFVRKAVSQAAPGTIRVGRHQFALTDVTRRRLAVPELR